MGRVIALGGAGLLLLAALAWLAVRPSGDYRYEPERAVYHKFSGALAFAHVEKLVAFGPRPAGSEALEASRGYLQEQLTAFGWATERQEFQDETPVGAVTFVNIRARYSGKGTPGEAWARPVGVVIGSHYDTKPYDEFEFVGANDGGSSTGALLEIARVTALRPALAKTLELVFFDGEEAFEPNITATDGLYGSRYYGKRLRRLDAEQRPKQGLILDMIGDKQLNVGVPSDSPYKPYQALMSAAKDLGHENYFGKHSSPIIDDHVPLNQSGVLTIDIIDLDYATWHTAGDTLDKVSAESLGIVGSTALLLVEKYLLGSEVGDLR